MQQGDEAGQAAADRQGAIEDKDEHDEDDLQHHMTAALAHVPADTAVVPDVVLHHVDLLQQVLVSCQNRSHSIPKLCFASVVH